MVSWILIVMLMLLILDGGQKRKLCNKIIHFKTISSWVHGVHLSQLRHHSTCKEPFKFGLSWFSAPSCRVDF